jgi:hypothetical protein
VSSGTAAPNWHSQLAAGVVDTIELASDFQIYEIISDDGSSRIDYTADGSAPVVGGSLTGRVLPAGAITIDTVYVNPNGSTVIKLKSAGTPTYSIQASQGPEPT